MKLLAIDTSTEQASVAISFGDELLHQEQGAQRTQAQFLLPMIDELLAKANTSMTQLDGIIFGCGPGSFTGLRIACSIAKGLAYANDLGLIPVSSLATIAWGARQQAGHADSAVLAVLDARMHEMYWAYYPPSEYVAEERVNPVADIALPSEQAVVLAGAGIDEYWADFPDALKAQVSNRLTVYPNAAAMIELVLAKNLPAIGVADAQPVYVRNQVTYDKNS
ncbi:tRNA (adenosine(37)-N6)-threonylcarbamoyltransferase complex dimerization subunit type 1 TsaB [Legionella lytica]|uniref:tRNA threonylcarbamoyladenosine biosynthesis protein TsaB n=1 Tax=Legionella lytica TaxID=96232 RepID=A0ABW8D9U2_9GAMM